MENLTKNAKTILITGGAGFVGHHVVEHFLKNTQFNIIVVDSLTYSGTLDRLRDIHLGPHGFSALTSPRLKVFTYNFNLPADDNLVKELKDTNFILHLGAESHVDTSIENPELFVTSNVLGTVNMLQLARKLPNLDLFVFFSTDEVFGPAGFGEKGYTEKDKHDPKNPYAASKSAAEQFVTAFANTYKLPCIITRTMNIFGERQHPQKFIPKVIKAVLEGGYVPIHGTEDRQAAGMRHYIHARNVADALDFLLKERPDLAGSVKNCYSYHIVGEIEVDNLSLANFIAELVEKECHTRKDVEYSGTHRFEIVDFHSSRPGHDLRYALDGSKMKRLGWEPKKTFHQSLKKTVAWYLDNLRWL